MPLPSLVVLGAGAWGTAIAALLALNNPLNTVIVWGRDTGLSSEINRYKTNHHYLPEITLPQNIEATSELKVALAQGNTVFQAIPVKHMRSIFTDAQPFIRPEHRFVSLSKGMEEGTLFLPTQIIEAILGEQVETAVVAGPTFAHELARQQLTAATIASTNFRFACDISHLMENDFFKTDISTDIISVQLCGVMKNIITLAIGIARGLGYGENAAAYLVTQGLEEMKNLIHSIKYEKNKEIRDGDKETSYELCGIGDLVLTALGTHSKNLKVGFLLGQGKSLQEVELQLGHLPEGINSAVSMHEFCIQHQTLDLPICNGVFKVIFKGLSPREFMQNITQN